MKIAIIGAGNVGSRLAKLFILAGHQIIVDSREQEKAAAIASSLGENVRKLAQLNIQIAYGLGGETDVAFRYMRR